MWKDIKHKEIAEIEKMVGEYNIIELNKSPYYKFKIKIFENTRGLYIGYTNIQVIDETGSFYCAVGHGKTEEEALNDTILEFIKLTSIKDEWCEEDFDFADPTDF